MKRTCKTCKHAFFSFFDGKLKCYREENHKGMVIPVDDKKPACEHYELALSALDDAFNASLAKAQEKHPVFLNACPKAEDALIHALGAKIWKRMIAKKTSFQLEAVLYSEVNEFLAEIARGNFERALEEAGDVMAVLYRALNGEGRKA